MQSGDGNVYRYLLRCERKQKLHVYSLSNVETSNRFFLFFNLAKVFGKTREIRKKSKNVFCSAVTIQNYKINEKKSYKAEYIILSNKKFNDKS